ncbi:MAG: hypothetical protein CL670_10415 [Balneola sp.]|jgi:hypothetical protein|nr:hypothetical protein [Balneola sp.]MBE79557.1 hypothetical protein [Balneola sp.]HBX65843.1 hypothetical protein [Balneolaceae bacterium]|tara:strand:+ start:308 stop:745 length:438 start_codon:yes stop_codon:yes gene_type:complete
MFIESDFYSILGSAIIFVLLFTIGFKFWEGKKEDELEKAISLLKINIFSTGFLLVVLWFMLPSTPSLGTFGFPETVNEIQSNEQLLNYLQTYNEAIVRTTQVVRWFIFIFVWAFLTTLYSVIKTFQSLREKDYFSNVKDEASAKR